MSICTYYLNGYIENILFINQKKSSVKNNLGWGVGRVAFSIRSGEDWIETTRIKICVS